MHEHEERKGNRNDIRKGSYRRRIYEKKEITTKENLMEVLNLLDSLKMKYWIDGGWGVDILAEDY